MAGIMSDFANNLFNSKPVVSIDPAENNEPSETEVQSNVNTDIVPKIKL
jgi:hypothetical protein